MVISNPSRGGGAQLENCDIYGIRDIRKEHQTHTRRRRRRGRTTRADHPCDTKIKVSCEDGYLTGISKFAQIRSSAMGFVYCARERGASERERGWKRVRARVRHGHAGEADGGKQSREEREEEDGRRTTTITLKAVRDTPAMVLICRPRFPSPRCHGFHGVLVIIRTFRPPSTFASRPPLPPPPPLHLLLFRLYLLRHLFPTLPPPPPLPLPPRPPLPPAPDARFHLRRYLAASLRASACIPYNRYVTL